jgi:hypothetical protein
MSESKPNIDEDLKEITFPIKLGFLSSQRARKLYKGKLIRLLHCKKI